MDETKKSVSTDLLGSLISDVGKLAKDSDITGMITKMGVEMGVEMLASAAKESPHLTQDLMNDALHMVPSLFSVTAKSAEPFIQILEPLTGWSMETLDRLTKPSFDVLIGAMELLTSLLSTPGEGRE